MKLKERERVQMGWGWRRAAVWWNQMERTSPNPSNGAPTSFARRQDQQIQFNFSFSRWSEKKSEWIWWWVMLRSKGNWLNEIQSRFAPRTSFSFHQSNLINQSKKFDWIDGWLMSCWMNIITGLALLTIFFQLVAERIEGINLKNEGNEALVAGRAIHELNGLKRNEMSECGSLPPTIGEMEWKQWTQRENFSFWVEFMRQWNGAPTASRNYFSSFLFSLSWAACLPSSFWKRRQATQLQFIFSLNSIKKEKMSWWVDGIE